MNSPGSIFFFSPDYAIARERFRRAATAAGWQLAAHPIAKRGPKGEELAIDVALSPLSGDSSSEGESSPVLLVSSGLHGVEGFFGSAVQLAALTEWAKTRAPRGVRCVFLHALNPYGFAWLRRVNETNVDLNRNFLREVERYRGSPPGYARLDGLLNPRRPPSPFEPVQLKFMYAIARHGMPALKEAIATGQYDYPQGLFYGGEAPSRSSEILAAHLPHWLFNARRVIHLDLHTGLGEWARHKLLLDKPLEKIVRERFTRWFGTDVLEVAGTQGVAYAARGSIGPWCEARLRGCDYVYAAAEFGTLSVPKVLAVLRAENQAHHWSTRGNGIRDRSERVGEAAGGAVVTSQPKQRLLELFCPLSPKWRRTTLATGVKLLHQAACSLINNR